MSNTLQLAAGDEALFVRQASDPFGGPTVVVGLLPRTSADPNPPPVGLGLVKVASGDDAGARMPLIANANKIAGVRFTTTATSPGSVDVEVRLPSSFTGAPTLPAAALTITLERKASNPAIVVQADLELKWP